MLELLVFVEEDDSVELRSFSVPPSPGPGAGPPGAGGPPPGGLGGCQPQQRPQDAPLPLYDLQNRGTTQLELVVQSGPVHIHAIVGLMSPELV